MITWILAFQEKLLYLMVFSLYSSLFWELRDKRYFKKNAFLTRKPRSHVRILIYRTWPNTESRLCTSLFLYSSTFFNSSPCSYHGLFYGHAMFIGNSQKEARYLSFLVFIAVRFIASKVQNNSRYFDSICWRIFYRRNRRHRVAIMSFQIKVSFVSTRRDSDKPEKI